MLSIFYYFSGVFKMRVAQSWNFISNKNINQQQGVVEEKSPGEVS